MALTITIPGAVEATIGATAPAILTVGVGVPGATGATGATGAQGPQGEPGEGVPVGGSAGQALVKVDGTDYNTTWSSLPAFLTKAGNLTGLTDINLARQNINLSTTDTPVFGGVDIEGSGGNYAHLTPTSLSLIQPGYGQFLFQPSQGIVFPDATTQTTAAVTPDLSGYLTKAGNLSGLANAATARTNLGLGTMATATATDYLSKAGNLSGLGNVTTARANLNLGPTVAQVFAGVSGSSGTPFSEDASYQTYNSSFTGFNSNYSFYTAGAPGEGGPYLTAIQQVEISRDSQSLFFSNNTYQTNGDLIASYELLLDSEGLASTRTVGSSWGIGIGGVTFPDTTVQTTAAVTPDLSGYALLASPVFTGNPTAPTATFGDNDTSIATTAFVQAGLLGGTAVARNLEVYVRNQSGASIPAGSIVFISGATGNRPLITLSQANNDANSAQTMGFTKTVIADNAFGYVIVRGEVENLDTSALTEGDQLYLSPTVAGGYTTTKPVAPQHMVYVGIVIRSHPTLGTILVAVQNGYELGEIHDVLLTTPANNDLLAYESSTDLWKNKSASTLGIAAINSQAFTGTPSLPTGTTGVTQTAGNNTTALATTAFVTAAVPAFATVPQVLTGTSLTTAINPSTGIISQLSPAIIQPNIAQYVASNSGGSSIIIGGGGNGFALTTPATAVGYAMRHVSASVRGVPITGNIQWTRPAGFCARLVNPNLNSFQTQAVTRVSLGKSDASGIYAGPPTARGIAVSYGASATNVLSALILEVHNGTSLTTVTSSFTPTMNIAFDVTVYSDGAGNVTVYANGTQVATTSAGPSTNGGSTYEAKLLAEVQNTSTSTTTSYVRVENMKYFVN